MAIERDDMVSLPAPPPPRPAARRQAIDAALRKFDGSEEPAPPRRARRPAWTTMHRRPAGALAAAALFAVIAIPVIQVALRDRPPEEVVSQERPSAPVQPAPDAGAGIARSEAPPPRPDQPVADATSSSPPQPSAPSIAAEERAEFASADRARKAEMPPPAAVPAARAPPPPPPPPAPPPPSAEPQAEAMASGDIVVTGSRMARPNLEAASPVATMAPDDEFLSRLQAGLRANDRRAVLALVGLPLRVNFDDGVRTYRSRRDVERDFDQIFTAEVRQAALNLRPGTTGNARLRFGPARDGSIRLVEVNP